MRSKLEIISNHAFAYTKKLSYPVLFTNNLKTIDDSAFEESSIPSFSFTDLSSITAINSNAFFKCVDLRGSITFPNSIIEIRQSAFSESHIETIEFNLYSKNVHLYSKAFYNCQYLTSISPYSHIDRIDDYCFANCFALNSSLDISVNKIQQKAFENCTCLKSVILQDTKSIGYNAFLNCGIDSFQCMGQNLEITYPFVDCCSNLKEIQLFDTINIVLSIENCSNLENIHIIGLDSNISEINITNLYSLSNLKSIMLVYASVNICGKQGFAISNLPNLQYIQLNNGKMSIRYGFFNCPKLEKIELIDVIYTSLGEYSFCNITNIPFPLDCDLIESYAFIECDCKEVLINAKIVHESAFYLCERLKNVKIGLNVQYIEQHFIDSCPSFESLSFIDSNDDTFNYNNSLTIGENALWKVVTFNLLTPFPNRLRIIDSHAFAGCTGITGSLVLPKYLERIESNAFEGCTGLNGFLSFDKCVNLTYIGSCAFLECSHLTG